MNALRFSLPLMAFVAALASPETAQVNTFTDIRARLPDLARPAVAWGDYDLDGRLDQAPAPTLTSAWLCPLAPCGRVNNLTKTGYTFDRANSVLSKSITK